MNILLKPFLVAAFLAGYAIAAQATAADQAINPSNVIKGMGERVPKGVKNVSLSPLFKVYTFERDGLRYVQINSLKDEVLTVLIVTPGAQQQLPLGSAAETPIAFVNDENARPLGMVTTAATCPCSSQVVYEDASTRIVVIYGANGEYIQTVVIDKLRTPGTKPNG